MKIILLLTAALAVYNRSIVGDLTLAPLVYEKKTNGFIRILKLLCPRPLTDLICSRLYQKNHSNIWPCGFCYSPPNQNVVYSDEISIVPKGNELLEIETVESTEFELDPSVPELELSYSSSDYIDKPKEESDAVEISDFSLSLASTLPISSESLSTCCAPSSSLLFDTFLITLMEFANDNILFLLTTAYGLFLLCICYTASIMRSDNSMEIVSETEENFLSAENTNECAPSTELMQSSATTALGRWILNVKQQPAIPQPVSATPNTSLTNSFPSVQISYDCSLVSNYDEQNSSCFPAEECCLLNSEATEGANAKDEQYPIYSTFTSSVDTVEIVGQELQHKLQSTLQEYLSISDPSYNHNNNATTTQPNNFTLRKLYTSPEDAQFVQLEMEVAPSVKISCIPEIVAEIVSDCITLRKRTDAQESTIAALQRSIYSEQQRRESVTDCSLRLASQLGQQADLLEKCQSRLAAKEERQRWLQERLSELELADRTSTGRALLAEQNVRELQLRADLDAATIQQLKDSLNYEREQNRVLESDLLKAKSDLHAQVEMCSAKSVSLDSAEKQVRVTQESLYAALNDIDVKDAEVKAKSIIIEGVTKELCQLKLESIALRDEICALSGDLLCAQTLRENQTETLALTQSELEATKQHVESILQEKEQLSKRLDSTLMESSKREIAIQNAKHDIENQLRIARDEIATLNNNCAQLVAEMGDNIDQLHSTRLERDEAEAALINVRSELDQSRNIILNLTADRDAVIGKLQSAEQERDDAVKNLITIREEMHIQSVDLKSLLEENKAELRNAQEEKDNALRQLNITYEELGANRCQIAQLLKELDERKVQLLSVTQERDNAAADIEKITIEKDEMSEQLTTARCLTLETEDMLSVTKKQLEVLLESIRMENEDVSTHTENMKQQLENLRNQVDAQKQQTMKLMLDHNDQISLLHAENNVVSAKYQDALNLVQELRQQIDSKQRDDFASKEYEYALQSQIETLQHDKHIILKQFEDVKLKVQYLQQDRDDLVGKLNGSVDALERQRVAFEEEKATDQTKLQELQVKFEAVTLEKERISTSEIELQGRLKLTAAEVDSLKVENKMLSADYGIVLQQLDELRLKLDVSRQESESIIEGQRLTMASEKQLLQEKLHELQNENVLMSSQYQDILKEVHELRSKSAAFRDERDSLMAQIQTNQSRFEADLEVLRQSENSLQQSKKDLLAELECVKFEAADLRAVNSRLSSEIEKDCSELVNLREQFQEIQAVSASRKIELDAARQESDMLGRGFLELQAQLEVKVAEGELLGNGVLSLQRQLNEAQRLVESKSQQIEGLGFHMAEIESVSLDLVSQFHENKADLQDVHAKVLQLESGNQHLTLTAQQAMEQQEELQDRIVHLDSEVGELKRERTQLKAMVQSLQEHVDTMNSELAQLLGLGNPVGNNVKLPASVAKVRSSFSETPLKEKKDGIAMIQQLKMSRQHSQAELKHLKDECEKLQLQLELANTKIAVNQNPEMEKERSSPSAGTLSTSANSSPASIDPTPQTNNGVDRDSRLDDEMLELSQIYSANSSDAELEGEGDLEEGINSPYAGERGTTESRSNSSELVSSSFSLDYIYNGTDTLDTVENEIFNDKEKEHSVNLSRKNSIIDTNGTTSTAHEDPFPDLPPPADRPLSAFSADSWDLEGSAGKRRISDANRRATIANNFDRMSNDIAMKFAGVKVNVHPKRKYKTYMPYIGSIATAVGMKSGGNANTPQKM